MKMLAVEDHIAITQLLNLYGHVIDLREWDRLGEVFVEDLVFDPSQMGTERMEGLANLIARWSSEESNHPLAHHATNILIWEDPDGTVRAQSKGYGPRPGGGGRTITYKDVVRRTPQGWRLARRTALVMNPRSNTAEGGAELRALLEP
jgi:hypothetical protein